jgi:CRISPR-associated endonuclease Cas2
MARKRVLDKPRQHITRGTLVKHLKNGDILSVAMLDAGEIKVLPERNSVWGNWNDYYPSSIERHTTRLMKRGVVEVVESEIGYVVKLTDKGRTEVHAYDLEAVSLSTDAPWDFKWRMVLFDLTGGAEYEKVRKILRSRLKAMGFYQLQKSVYVTPYPCENQVANLTKTLKISKNVRLAIVTKIDGEEELIKHFGL